VSVPMSDHLPMEEPAPGPPQEVPPETDPPRQEPPEPDSPVKEPPRALMTKRSMRLASISISLVAAAIATQATATLPPPSDAAVAQAAEAKAKAAWADKVGAFQTCRSMDRTAEAYRQSLKGAGKDAPPAMPTPPCTDPGPYVSPATASASKPLEASGAHSPPGQAVTPPSTKVPAAEMTDAKK